MLVLAVLAVQAVQAGLRISEITCLSCQDVVLATGAHVHALDKGQGTEHAAVVLDRQGVLHGRSDDTMKISGRRIGPAELEAALLKDRRVVEVAVIGVPDEMRGQRVVAFVVVADEDIDHEDLVATAERNVGRSFAPSVHVVAALPKTTNGKIMRRTIRARHLGEPLGDLTSLDSRLSLEAIPPATTTQEKTT